MPADRSVHVTLKMNVAMTLWDTATSPYSTLVDDAVMTLRDTAASVMLEAIVNARQERIDQAALEAAERCL